MHFRGLMRIPPDLGSVGQIKWFGYGVALVAVGMVTALLAVAESRFGLPNVSMWYLVAVLATATAFGSGPAVVASLAAFLAFDWFFVEPRFTFAVANSEEWLSLVLFLLTATLTGQLAAGQRRRADEAARREREIVVLYDVVRMLAEWELDRALGAVADRLLQELELDAVAIDLADPEHNVASRAEVGDREALRRILPVQVDLGWAVADDRLHLVPVRLEARQLGAMALVRHPGRPPFSVADERLLSAVASQLGSAVERTRLRREAMSAEILRGADDLKTALLHAVSHNLRTPLASIIAFSGSLRQTDVSWSEGERQEFAVAIEQEALRLNRIVGNLLDLSRMEAGELQPEKSWYDLGALVDDVLGRLQPILGRHAVVVDVAESLPPVLLDYVEIDQVLSNLLENAAKYTPVGTEIKIAARASGDYVEVEVADRGAGIAPSAFSGLFDPFFRGGESRGRPQGTGLGLAVSRGLVRAHRGELWAENRLDGGARFVFTLPLQATSDDANTLLVKEEVR